MISATIFSQVLLRASNTADLILNLFNLIHVSPQTFPHLNPLNPINIQTGLNLKTKNHSKNDFQAATKTQKPKSSLKPFAMKNKSPAERKTRHGKGCAGYARRQGNCVRARP